MTTLEVPQRHRIFLRGVTLLISCVHASARGGLEKTFCFLFQLRGRPRFFVDAQLLVVRTNSELASVRHIGAVDLEMIAVGVIEIKFSPFGSRAGNGADEGHLPSPQMLRPSLKVVRRRIKRGMRMRLVPTRLAIV